MSGIHEVRGAIHGKNYVLVRPLVEGTSAVFEARHDRNSGTYVVRLFPPEIRSRSETSLRIQGGARLSSLLRHTGIAQVLDFNVTGEEPTFVVTEYIPGRSLEDAMAEDGMLPLPLSIELVGQLVESLRAAHAMGIVHGDLHPGAIRLTKNASGKIVTKLLGFGWGRELRASGRRGGGWTYVAPEQLVPGAQRIDERADQFLVGRHRVRDACGCSPFSEESTDLADPEARRYRLPPPVAQMVLGLPAGLDDVLRRALSYDPGERFPRLQDFASALQRVAGGTTAAGAGTTRVTWEWPAPSVYAISAPAEILPTPPPVFSAHLLLGTNEEASEETIARTSENTVAAELRHAADAETAAHAETLAVPESPLADSVGFTVKDEDSDGVPVPLPPATQGSMEIALAPPPHEDEDHVEARAREAGAPENQLAMLSEVELWASRITPTAPETLDAGEQTPLPVAAAATIPPEDVRTPLPMAATATAMSTDGAPVPVAVEAAPTIPSEDGQQTPLPVEVAATIPPGDREQTPVPFEARMTAPPDDGERTPLPLEVAATAPPDDRQQTPVPREANVAAPPRDGDEASLASEAAALAWIMSERPQTTDEANGIVFSGVHPTPPPIADDTHIAGDSHLRSSPVLHVSTPPVILAGPNAWKVSGVAEPTLSPLLHPVVAKPRPVTRVLFVAATLTVIVAAVSVMSGMREKVPTAEVGAARADPQAHSTAALHRPTTVNVARAVKAEPVPAAPTAPAAPPMGPVVVPTVTQATAESRNERTRPLRGHSRHGASRAGGRRDHRGR